MTSEDYLIEKLGKALIACAEAQDAVPAEWDETKQAEMRRSILAAMGLLQPSQGGLAVYKNEMALKWDVCLVSSTHTEYGDVSPGFEKRVRSVPARLLAYTLLGRHVLGTLSELLNSYDGRRYREKLGSDATEKLASGLKGVRAVEDAVGEDGIFPWL